MKRSQAVWLFVGGVAMVALSGGFSRSEPEEMRADVFSDRDQCAASGRYASGECDRAATDAALLDTSQAPRFASRTDCAAEFPDASCRPLANGGSSLPGMFAPAMAGFLIGNAIGG